MNKPLRKQIVFLLSELCISIILGLLILRIIDDKLIFNSYIVTFSLVYFTALTGLFVLGYIYLKSINRSSNWGVAMIFAIGWTFLAAILYIILAYLADFHFLQSKEVGLIFPIICGVTGYNLIAFSTVTHNK